MRIRSIVIGTFVACSSLRAATVATTADLLHIVGSGANLATLVIDFNDGTASESFAWGFRWDGEASGADMLLAIAAADPGLTLASSGDGDAGFFVSGIGYFDGVTNHSRSGGSFVTFPDDYISWGYYLAGGFAGGTPGVPDAIGGGGSSLPSSWTSSPSGASVDSFGTSGRLLTDGAWDTWSFGAHSEDFTHMAPPGGAPLAAVPEPSVMLAIVASLGFFPRRKRR